MPTPAHTEKSAKVNIDPTERRLRRLETTARKLTRELEDMRDILEIKRAREVDAGNPLLALGEAWKKLGLSSK